MCVCIMGGAFQLLASYVGVNRCSGRKLRPILSLGEREIDMVATGLPKATMPSDTHSIAILYYAAVVTLVCYGVFMMVHIISVVYG